jgi:hypothetical protein
VYDVVRGAGLQIRPGLEKRQCNASNRFCIGRSRWIGSRPSDLRRLKSSFERHSQAGSFPYRDRSRTLLARAAHQSKRKNEELVAELSPKPDAPATLRKLPERRRNTPAMENCRLPLFQIAFFDDLISMTELLIPSMNSGHRCFGRLFTRLGNSLLTNRSRSRLHSSSLRLS